MIHNQKSFSAAQAAISAHAEALGIEGDASIQLWHMLASMSEWAAVNRVSLVDELLELHDTLRNGELDLPAAENVREVEARKLASPQRQQPLLNAIPRVLVVVSGGIADPVSDNGVEVEVFDWDNYKDDPEGTGGVPAHFSDLAALVKVPVEAEVADQVTSPGDAPSGVPSWTPIFEPRDALPLPNGIGRPGDDVEHSQFGLVRLNFSDERGWHYLRWGHAGFDNDFENVRVREVESLVFDRQRG